MISSKSKPFTQLLGSRLLHTHFKRKLYTSTVRLAAHKKRKKGLAVCGGEVREAPWQVGSSNIQLSTSKSP